MTSREVDVHVAELWIHPVKSLAGSQVERVVVDARGLVNDRRFMVVDDDGVFVTQRELPKMATLSARIEAGELNLEGASGSRVAVSLAAAAAGAGVDVEIWGERARATVASSAASEWLSDALGRSRWFVFQPERLARPVDARYAGPADRVSFADGFSLLLTSTSSLAELNRRLVAAGSMPVPMSRFRPNVVIKGAEPFAEDSWKTVRVVRPGSEMHFALRKPCERCTMTTVDAGRKTKEPLATLATFRRIDGKILFGHNVVHTGAGELTVGMEVVCES